MRSNRPIRIIDCLLPVLETNDPEEDPQDLPQQGQQADGVNLGSKGSSKTIAMSQE